MAVKCDVTSPHHLAIVVITPDMQFLKWEVERVPSEEYGGGLLGGEGQVQTLNKWGKGLQCNRKSGKRIVAPQDFLGVLL